ncbi:hypothetical protein PVK06_026640 [Gossypium arboreum]|uniref:DUF7745 domain-containing protein n=1 Tax=Gossypium arboreum TaxID=29729 RepID=A0ABR0NY67_GOSAR|nr:hypothetical protein PVK06_026640 [Gossypium arboreum]
MTAVVAPLSGSEKLRFREVFTSVSNHGSISRLESFVMRNEYIDKVEDKASVCAWSEKTQLEKGDSVTEGAYVRVANLPTFVKKLMSITGMSEQWAAARIQQKGDRKCIPWASLRDTGAPRYEAVVDLFDRLGKQVTPVPAVLAETFRYLSACRRAGEGIFIGCAQLLLVWFHSHFWKVKVPCRVFFEDYSPLKEAAATPRRDDITEERWMEILQNLQEEDVMWKAPLLAPNEVIYRCESFDWVPLPGIWGVFGYVPLLILRQYKAG